MQSLLIWTTGFVLGFLHAFDPDHLAAISTFVSRNPGKRAAARFALEWGAGHSLSLLALTLLVLFVGKGIGAGVEKALESAVGMALIGLGSWRLVDFFQERYRVHSHAHDIASREGHEHFHVHGPRSSNERHDHSHVAGFVGILHGAAGSARFLVLIPIAIIGSLPGAVAYVVFFSCGVTAAMMSYAVFLGRLFETSERRFSFLRAAYQPLTALVSMGLGIYWIYGNW